MEYNVITTDEELRENGLMHYHVHKKNSCVYGKEFMSLEAAQQAASNLGEKIYVEDCTVFTKYSEINEYENEKWKKIKEKKYPDFVPIYGKIFANIAGVNYPY